MENIEVKSNKIRTGYITEGSTWAKTIGANNPKWFVAFYNNMVDCIDEIKQYYPTIDFTNYIVFDNEPGFVNFSVSNKIEMSQELRYRLDSMLILVHDKIQMTN